MLPPSHRAHPRPLRGLLVPAINRITGLLAVAIITLASMMPQAGFDLLLPVALICFVRSHFLPATLKEVTEVSIPRFSSA
jgi:hypothetical protein